MSMTVFVKVAQAGSLSAAAQALGLSKSTVSKHVSALEEHLGVLLLNRTTRRLSLTDLGAAYRDHAQRILGDIEETEIAIQGHTVEPKGKLRVNAPMSFGILHIAPQLPGLHGSAPADRDRAGPRRSPCRPDRGRLRRRHSHRPPGGQHTDRQAAGVSGVRLCSRQALSRSATSDRAARGSQRPQLPALQLEPPAQ